jgi:hypothetical protein
LEEQAHWALSVQSYDEDEDVGPQPTIAEVKRMWTEEAPRLGSVKGQDMPGSQKLKRVLGKTYTNPMLGAVCRACEQERPRPSGSGRMARGSI